MSESNESDTKELNIYQRINAVMAEMPPMEPDKEHPVFKDKKKVGSFPYYSHDGVTKVVQPLFTKHGIVVRPSVVDKSGSGNRVELTVEVDFINIDDPTDRMTLESVGFGCDGFDKGPGKAMSYALKVAYQKVLMLNSGDDTGEDAVEHDPTDTRTSDVDEAQQATRKAIEASANTYKAGIAGAETVKELRALKTQNDDWLADAPTPTQDYFAGLFKTRITSLESEEG